MRCLRRVGTKVCMEPNLSVIVFRLEVALMEGTHGKRSKRRAAE